MGTFLDIIDQITESAEKAFKISKSVPKKNLLNKPWWDEECEELIKNKRRAFKLYKATNDRRDMIEYKKLRAKAKNRIKKNKN